MSNIVITTSREDGHLFVPFAAMLVAAVAAIPLVLATGEVLTIGFLFVGGAFIGVALNEHFTRHQIGGNAYIQLKHSRL